MDNCSLIFMNNLPILWLIIFPIYNLPIWYYYDIGLFIQKTATPTHHHPFINRDFPWSINHPAIGVSTF
jgi:hypothetical protein